MAPAPQEEPEDKPAKVLDAEDVHFLKTYGLQPYARPIKAIEADIKDIQKRVTEVCGIKESDTGLAPPSRWDLVSDKQMVYEDQPLQVRAAQGCSARHSTHRGLLPPRARSGAARRRAPSGPPLCAHMQHLRVTGRRAVGRAAARACTRGSPPGVRAGGALQQDYQRQHGRRQIHDQREADRQVRGQPGRQGCADRH